MEQFTFKDFITYNNPCFSCGENINFNIISTGEILQTCIKPIVSQEYTQVNLKLRYVDKYSLYFQVFHKTNKFKSNNLYFLKKYLQEHKLYLTSECSKCFTLIKTNQVLFDLNNQFILPMKINSECLIVNDSLTMYRIISDFSNKVSSVFVFKKDKSSPTMNFEVPLLPRYKFKNREHLINKIKTYIIFS